MLCMGIGHEIFHLIYFSFQGLALDERGRFSGEAEKKLQEVILSPNKKNKK